jgi:type I restriction enzyme S subunit
VQYNPNLLTYLRITDISEDGKFIEEGKKSVNHPDVLNYILEEGDIVFARTGNSTGKTYLYDSNDGALVFAGFLIRFKPLKGFTLTVYQIFY